MRDRIKRAINRSGLQQKEVALGCGFDEQNFSKMLSGTLRLDVDLLGPIISQVGIGPLEELAAEFGFELVPLPQTKETVLCEIEKDFERLVNQIERLREAMENESQDEKRYQPGRARAARTLCARCTAQSA